MQIRTRRVLIALTALCASVLAPVSLAASQEVSGAGSPWVAPQGPEAIPPPDWAVDQALERGKADEARRQTPAAEQYRSDSATAFMELGAAGATELFLSTFADQLAQATPDPSAALRNADRILGYADPGTAVIDPAGPETRALHVSTLPLRTEQGQLPALDLEREGTTIESQAPLTEATLPDELADGLEFAPVDVSLDLEGAAADDPDSRLVSTSGAEGDKEASFYPEALTDTDIAIAPIATGVETFAQLRSEQSPDELTFNVDFPTGAKLVGEPGGGAAVVNDGKLLVTVQRPSAVDAQGAAVPVTMKVEGNKLILQVPHRGAGWAYPILVDPVIENWDWYNTWPGFAGWVPSQNWAYFEVNNYCNVYLARSCDWTGNGLHVRSYSWYPYYFVGGTYGQWTYEVPNGLEVPTGGSTTSYISSASVLYATYDWAYSDSIVPYMYMGLLNAAGAYTSVTTSYYNWCCQWTFGGAGSAKKMVAGLWSSQVSYPSWPWHSLRISQLSMDLNDAENPRLTGSPADTGWLGGNASFPVNMGATDIALGATDGGLGVKKFRLDGPAQDGSPASQFTPPGCAGGRASECPRTVPGPVNFSTYYLAEGDNTVSMVALDAAEKASAPSPQFHVKVDRSKPTIDLKGDLADVPGGVVKAQPYGLEIVARDGSTESPELQRSGVTGIEVKLDDQPVPIVVDGQPVTNGHWVGSCPQGSCEKTANYTLDGAGVSVGHHTLTVKVTDQLGNETTKSIPLSVKGFAGVIVTPESGDTTARRLQLQAELRDPLVTGAKFEFRRPGGSWTEISVDYLLNADGSTHPGYPLPFVDGKTAPVTWDVPATPGINGVNGAISVRARFTGPGGPPTVVADNPSLYWRLGEPDGTSAAADSSGNNRPGTYVGAPDMWDDGAPVPLEDDDGAVDLNGSGQFVNSGYNAFANANAHTYVGWANRETDIIDGTLDTLIAGGGGYEDAPFLILGEGVSIPFNDVRWQAWYTEEDAEGNPVQPLDPIVWPNAWPGLHQWVHWALVFDQYHSTAELFINGQSKGLQSTLGHASAFSADAGPLTLGAWPAVGISSSAFNGKMDEVAVYDQALDQAKIQNQMSGIHKGFSQVVPVTLDSDTTTSKHASTQIGPGSLDLLTGNFSLTQDDVKLDSYGSDLTVSRTYNSRTPGDPKQFWTPFGQGWTSSIPVDAAGSDYAALFEAGPAGDPTSAIKVMTSDSTEILFNRQGSNYQVEPMFTGFELEANSGQYILKDLDGNATTFYKPAGASNFAPLKVRQTGVAAQTTTRYGYEPTPLFNVPRVKFALAPVPAGVTCTTGAGPDANLLSQLPRGCRVLRFHYLPWEIGPSLQPGEYPYRLMRISFEAWDQQANGGAGAMTTVDVAKYYYDANGRLAEAWDPRISPALKTTYTYDDATGHLMSITPAGENAWTLAYQTISGDPNTGRLRSVSRAFPGGATATTRAVYDVSLSGDSGAPSMTPGDVDGWGQSDVPTDATAILPPDISSGSDLTKAMLYYMNRNGDLVNVARKGEEGNSFGEISTTEYDEHRQVKSDLTPGNRVRALQSSNPAEMADVLETDRIYDPEGVELRETFGPQHQVQLADGSLALARQHRVTTYDQDRPTGQDYHLPTKEALGVSVCSGPLDCPSTPGQPIAEARTTETKYNWSLRQPTQVTADPDGFNVTTKTTYDAATGLPVETRMPKANASGTDAHTTKTIYYTAAGNSAHPECGGRPEWANLACKVVPGGQSSGPAPDLPITRFESYNIWNQPTSVRVDAESAPDRVTTTVYDGAGRTRSTSLTGGQGTAVPMLETNYDPDTGRATETSSDGRTISRTFDDVGRETSYTDAAGQQSTTQYDLLSRPTEVTDGKSTISYSYDPTTGRLETMLDNGVGAFGAEYDPDGNVVTETLPNQTILETTYDSVGAVTSRAYRRQQCAVDCGVMSFNANRSSHGQVTSEEAYIGDVLQERNSYTYDRLSRLTRAYNDLNGPGCTRRDYDYDADANRTSMESVAPLPSGDCDTAGSGTIASQTYDEADRIIDAGYTYDDFGRTLTVPAEDAGGSGLTASYFTNDRVRTLSQDGVIHTFSLDPASRVRVRATSGQMVDETYHYSDGSDAPSWIARGSSWTRYPGSIGGGLSAIQEGDDSMTDSVRYQLSNIHGDVVGETNADGDLTGTFDSDEFGVPQGAIPASGYGWLGAAERRAQLASGAITMGARVYLPQIGRFLQVDPVPGGSANDYDYAGQDPVNATDLGGTAVCDVQGKGTLLIEHRSYCMLRVIGGLTPIAASALVGNFYAESSIGGRKLNPKAIQDGGAGPGHGLAQWEAHGRFDTDRMNLRDYAAKKLGGDGGDDCPSCWKLWDLQIQFVIKELRSKQFRPVMNRLNSMTSLAQATRYVRQKYLKTPGTGTKALRLRRARGVCRRLSTADCGS